MGDVAIFVGACNRNTYRKNIPVQGVRGCPEGVPSDPQFHSRVTVKFEASDSIVTQVAALLLRKESDSNPIGFGEA
jgi:hypothetical protein